MNSDLASSSRWLLATVSLLVSLAAAPPVSGDGPLKSAVALWIRENLSAAEIEQVRDLADRIDAAAALPENAPADLCAAVRRLSIREAAGLGTLLLDEYNVDPAPWVALPYAREKGAEDRLLPLVRHSGAGYAGPPIERTVRGPSRLRRHCGEAMLTEVTGVGFWEFYEEGVDAPTSFGDPHVDILLALPGLEWIRASRSKLTDEGGARLATLSRLRIVRFAETAVGDRTLRGLGRNPALREIDVAQARHITDDGVKALENIRGLEKLDLSGTAVTSDSLETIAGFSALRELSLDHTRVHENISKLGRLQHLRRLVLDGLGTTDAPIPSEELAFLSSLKDVESLSLKGTAVKRLAVNDLPRLSDLDLGDDVLTDLALTDLPKLRELAVMPPGNERSSLQLEQLTVRGLPSVVRIAMPELSAGAADGLARGLATMPRVASMSFSAGISDALATAIGELPQLEVLTVNALTDAQLAAVARAQQLSFLRAGGESLTSPGLRELRRGTALTRLQLEDLTVDEADFLGEMPALKSLRLDRCQISDLRLDDSAAVPHLEIREGHVDKLTARRCEALQHLSLSECRVNRLTIESCPRFSHLFCGGNALLDRVVLRDLPVLTSMTFQEGTTLGDCELEGLPAVRDVSFWAANVSTRHLEPLLKNLPELKRLDVSGTRLGDEAAKVLARLKPLETVTASPWFGIDGLSALATLPALRDLKLYHRPESDWTPDEARRLFSHVENVAVFQLNSRP